MIINMKIRLPQPQSDPNLPAYRSDTSASLSHMFSNRGFLTKTKLKFVDIPSSHPHKAMFMLILLLSGDIESNPGPTGPAPKSMFPCAVCQQHVSWKHSAVECDNCDVWLHRSCASLTSSQYNRIEDESWTCYCCRSINPASFVFKAYNLNTSNSFEPLASIPGDDSVFTSDNVASPTDSFTPSHFSSPKTLSPPNPATGNSSSASSTRTSSPSAHDLSSSPAKRNNLRIGTLNANSIKGKRAELAELIHSTQLDILIISETKLPSEAESKTLSSTYKPSEILPKNFESSIHRPRSLHGGGVMVAVRKGIIVVDKPLQAGKDGEVVCAKISMENSQPLYVCAYYRPNKDTVSALDSLELALTELQTELDKDPRAGLIVAGDFNAPGIDWESLTVNSKAPNKGMCQRLLSMLGTYELTQFVQEPTRHKAILDLFCFNKPGLVKHVSLIPGISDHDGVIIVDTAIKAAFNKKPKRIITMWSKADWNHLKKEAASFCTEFLNTCGTRNVQENWEILCTHMKTWKELIPSKPSSTRFNLPWITPDIKRMLRKKRRVYNKAKGGNDKHRAAFKKIQNESRDALNTAHWTYVNNMLLKGLEGGDNKQFYQYLKAQGQDSQGVAPLKVGSQLLSDALSKARTLGTQFSSVFTKDSKETADIRKEGPSYPAIGQLNITTEGVEKLLRGLNPGKAAGPDGMTARMMKLLSEEIAPILTSIFRQSLVTGTLPTDWTKAFISPVFKKGDRSSPANYRPVSLTCIACKLMEHILCTHIRAHLDYHQILTPENHEFRSRLSCETQLLLTTHNLIKERYNGKRCDP